jgi:hypothetical protein
LSFATKSDGNAFGNLFFASEAPHKGVSSLSPDNAFAAKVSACYKGCVSSRGLQGKTLACLFDFGLVLETIEHAWRDRRGHHRLAV